MIHKIRRRGLRKRAKRLMAAVAGAAVMSSALLPGIPATALAAENTGTSTAPTTTEQNTNVSSPEKTNEQAPQAPGKDAETARPAPEKGDRPGQDKPVSSPLQAAKQAAGKYGFNANRDKFSVHWQSNTEAVVLVKTRDGQTYKMRLSKDRGGDWKVTSVSEVQSTSPGQTAAPVDVVKASAALYGFNARTDKFSLLSITGSTAVVQVQTSSQKFKVDLKRTGGEWKITTIRGIGNGSYPATYIPASMFRNVTVTTTVTPARQMLFETNRFDGWFWNETTTPQSMNFGIFLSNPRGADNIDFIPGDILTQIDKVDFTRQFVLYTHLGDVADLGYGIGIEKVFQSGNNFTVTVKMLSPTTINGTLPPTKADDYLVLNNEPLNLQQPLHFTFVDQTGRELSNYTFVNG